MTLSQQHQESVDLVRHWVEEGRPLREICQDVVAHLRAGYPHYNWVGVYMVEGAVLRLWAWDGPAPTQHVEIPLHSGVCGWAASTGETVNVPDVNQDPRYLQCFLQTRSELVVPIRRGSTVYGEIDIDSDALAAFGPQDEAFVQAICELLAQRAAAEALTGRTLGA